jgi:RNA polymerase sigma-B factor
MSVSNHRTTSSAQFDDLDVAALAYSSQWTGATADRRSRLRDDLIQHCLPFASRMACRYRDRGEPVDDLEQVARIGLIEAIDRYDPDRGSFTAFAVVTMSGELKRHFRDKTWRVHVPRRLQDLSLEIRHASAVLTNMLARTPTVAEIARYLQIPENAVREALKCATGHSPMSLSTPVGGAGSHELGDLVGGTDAALETVADRLTVTELLQRLPARERQILAMRFYGNHTQMEIAAELGISQMHVSRLLSRALAWLRAAMLSEVPPCWDGPGSWHDVPELRVGSSVHAGVVTVHVRGEVDRDTAERLRLNLRHAVALAMAARERIVVDLAAVPLIDAAGVSVLLDAAAAAAAAEVGLVLAAARPYVARVLGLSGLGALLSAEP